MNFDPQKDVDCLIVGYAGVDRIIKVSGKPEKGKTVGIINRDNHDVTYGGNGSNVAACMARLGLHTIPFMRVGEDWERLGYKQTLIDYGVDISGITVIHDELTSVCHLIEAADGSHLTMTYPGAMNGLYAADVYNDDLFHRARFGVVTVSTRRDVELFLEHAKEADLRLVFGVRIDRECFSDKSFEYLLNESEIIFMNETERDYIESNFRPLKQYLERGKARQIIVTLGEQGSLILEKQTGCFSEISVPALTGYEVVDTTGAGDSFIAGYLYGLLNGMDARSCALYGSAEASFIIQKQGCITGAPDPEKLKDRIEEYKEK